ncbi:MAG: hypothetical protein WBA97_25305 [Actinophytocola sp.]|uniref:hypothetical protein n=1 Tax=Actinophytocola sp. TaxID=1872138 RepID=UPI003C777D95
MATEFEGMRAWRPASEIIECLDTALGTVDMHNDYDFREVTVSPGKSGLTVGLRFTKTEGSPAERFTLTFHRVQGLELTSKEAGFSEDRNVFHAIEYAESANSGSEFSVETEALTLSFRSNEVQFEAIA